MQLLVPWCSDAWSEGDSPRVLSPDLVQQLTLGGFANSHGSKGHNCDLHVVQGYMGANFNELVARALTTIAHLVEAFDSNTGINPGATASGSTVGAGNTDCSTTVQIPQKLQDNDTDDYSDFGILVSITNH